MADRVERRLAALLASDVVGYSRLMGQDEIGTLAALKALRRDLIDPVIAAHRGRIVNTVGDAMLVEFASVVDAVGCAVAIQRGTLRRHAGVAEDRRIWLRIGINVGDVIIDGTSLYGDGVNVAARLEGLCEPGGLCISRSANEQIRDKLSLAFADLGEHVVKNIQRAVGVFGLTAADIARLPEDAVPPATDAADAPPAGDAHIDQDIRFCVARDGVRLAYSRIGQGPPLIKTGNWMTHLEYDLESPIWRGLYRELARDASLVRYDARGNGLSDREVEDISFDAFVHDLETVADAAGEDRFALFAISQGCAVAIAYAVRHPERVSRLVLYGGYPQGALRRGRADEREKYAAMETLTRVGWGQENAAFRQLFTSQFVPGATKEQADWFNELQRVSASPETAVRCMRATAEIDVTDLLGRVMVPTLVMHARDEARVPFDEGRRMAAGIPGARFVPLPSRNHLILDTEPAFGRFVDEIRSFLRG
jgi:class 3 adenylate cyclase/pimeloyl-ACP methyl ester carboxylesterase